MPRGQEGESIMAIPGFTAEASLSKAAESYLTSLVAAGEGGSVTPQAIVRRGNTIYIFVPGDPWPVATIHIPTLY